jgi:alpha-amylase/alpha-mannosidase (GH57 family)
MASHEQMVRPYPRYAELLARRGADRHPARDVLHRFHERDLRDLQVWFNLTWIHPLAFEQDAELRRLRDKGRHFTEEEKHWVLDRHLEILRQIIPLHRRLAESGQVELTTSPYFHPILPLLLDKKLAREALPEVKLPHYTGGYPEDAAVHVRRAVEMHTQVFGRPPRGMWPAEGSVCQTMLPLLAEHGIRWLATDEEILSGCTQGFISRDNRGFVRNPERMYRPYRVAEAGHALGIVFRDHALSDMIGFQYQRSEPESAADDLLGHLRAIGQAVTGDQPALVSIILDGENCWEHYPGGGVPFLRGLYRRLAEAQDVQPVQAGEFLERHPPRDTLPHLFAGGWINHNFAIWIGHEEDNTAWDALHRAREHLRERAAQRQLAVEPSRRANAAPLAADAAPLAAMERAWEEIYIAEGSDWFWWYGDDHASAQDALFDHLFRTHLQNVYRLLGDVPPVELSRPIKRRGQRAMYTVPRSFLDVHIDGRKSFLQWIGAGHYTCQNERGTMAMVTRGPIKDVYFGFNPAALLVRVDFDRPARLALADFDALCIGFMQPAGWELRVPLAADLPAGRLPHGRVQLLQQGEPRPADGVAVGIDQTVEASVPFAGLGVRVNEPVQFYVELLQGRQSRDRAPREGVIALACPPPDFERIMWNV